MDAEAVRSWVEGWVVSRGAAPPVSESWGFTIDVGLSGHVTRHVLTDADESLVRKLTETVTVPGTWLKIFLPPQTVASWAAPGWRLADDGFLMSTPLRTNAAVAPDGYQVRTWARGGVTRVLVVTEDGAFAARGQIALPGPGRTAVFDQIETSSAHRRRGSAASSCGRWRTPLLPRAPRPLCWPGRLMAGRCTSSWGGAPSGR